MTVKSSSALSLFIALVGCSSLPERNRLACDIPPTSLVAAFAESKRIPGMAVAVAVRGELAWSHGYGFSDLDTSSRVVADKTLFRIGSTSKALTGFTVAKLAQDGRLNIDTGIRGVLPDLPLAYEDVTIRQLAGHLAGVRHYASRTELGSNIEFETTAQALGIFIDDPLIAMPGHEYSYSTYGYTVIGAALEAVIGDEYLSFMSKEVFEPLKMQNTTADRRSIQVPERTQFYYLGEDGEPAIGPPINSSYKWAGGGFLATAVDLARFGVSHFDGNLLTDASQRMLWTSQKTLGGDSTGYGIGWFISDHWVQHPGGALGGSTLLRIYPEEEVVIAITANLSMLGPNRFGALPEQLFECTSRN